uniref:Putative chemosensory protein 8 n=1 Tax=Conopomorpha sinensis TaxID=940481 RepID=A0A649ZUQ7_9NEOP|nr:putative chemosensory protein 8 [Conopomorpha sinensis]
MRSLILLAFVVAGVTCESKLETYDPKYDNFPTEELLENMPLLKSYIACLLDNGPCTTAAADFKRVLPEALSTDCVKCTPKMKQRMRVVIMDVRSRLPDEWELLVKKYNPDGEHKNAFERFMNVVH